MLTEEIRPTTIVGIKRLAKQLSRSSTLLHAAALDQAARSANFANYAHACRVLKDASIGSEALPLFLTIYWYDAKERRLGRETLKIGLARPFLDLCTKNEMKLSRGLSWMRAVADDHLVSDTIAQSQSYAREIVCKAVRELRFMEHTGLKPCKSYGRAYPTGNSGSKLPNSDHPSYWIDPVSDGFVLIDEPYGAAIDDADRLAWARKYNWHLRLSTWPGMYYPHQCSMFVATSASSGVNMNVLMDRIAGIPDPVTEEAWVGESEGTHEIFLSPLAKTAQDKRRARPKGLTYPRPSKSTIPYGGMFGGVRRRPNGKMPIDKHIDVGQMIKAILQSRLINASIERRLDSFRSTIEDWLNNEIERDELSDVDFFDVYYHDVLPDSPYPAQARTHQGIIGLIDKIEIHVSTYYPDCAPLRSMVRKLDFSRIAIARKSSSSL